MSQVEALFRTAFYLAKNGRPFRDFKGLLQLHQCNGVTVGSTYWNEINARVFVMYIHEAMFARMKMAVASSKFFSILSDGSTDSANVQEEIVYIRFHQDGRPTTKLVALKPVEKADAESITKAVVEAMETDLGVTDWHDKVIAAGVDGANVMIGHLSGVVTRLSNKSSGNHVLGIHCLGHKLELVFKYFKRSGHTADIV